MFQLTMKKWPWSSIVVLTLFLSSARVGALDPITELHQKIESMFSRETADSRHPAWRKNEPLKHLWERDFESRLAEIRHLRELSHAASRKLPWVDTSSLAKNLPQSISEKYLAALAAHERAQVKSGPSLPREHLEAMAGYDPNSSLDLLEKNLADLQKESPYFLNYPALFAKIERARMRPPPLKVNPLISPRPRNRVRIFCLTWLSSFW